MTKHTKTLSVDVTSDAKDALGRASDALSQLASANIQACDGSRVTKRRATR